MKTQPLSVMEIESLFENSIETPPEPLMTTEELANYMRVRPDTVRTWASTLRYFPYYSIGGRKNRYKASEVLDYFRKNPPRR